MEKKKVIVEKDLEDLIPKFLENRKKDIELIRQAIIQNDIETLKSVGHRMKGVCGGYGFHELGALCGLLEAAVLKGDMNSVKQNFEKMSQLMLETEVVYE